MSRRKGVLCLLLSAVLLTGISVTTTEAADGDTTFRASASYFSWTVGRGELDYAFPTNGSVASLEPESDGGFRLEFEMMKGQATYMIGYTSYEVEDMDDVNDPNNLSGTLIVDDVCSVCQPVSFAESMYEQEYSMFNLGVGYQLRPDSDFGLQFIGGLVFGSIEEENTVLYSDDASVTGDTDVVEMETEVDTFGFHMGLVPSYEFNEFVSIFGVFNYSPMMADIDRTYVYREGGSGTSGMTTEFDVDVSETEIIHKTDFEVGVEITPIEWLSLELGYQNEVWLNYPAFMKITSESGEETIDRGGDGMSTDGFFFTAGFEF